MEELGFVPDFISEQEMQLQCVNALRFLSVDAVQKANSGHPGLPLGCAPMAFALWDRFLKFNPRDPSWPDRDRFVLSAGHGCALLYSLLHLTGFELSIDDLKNFRQWGSKTPGHPEHGKIPGVEATTGPLGQGFGNAVGMAIAEVALAAKFNKESEQETLKIVDHYTYVLAGDGDMMEGVTSEAASLAGHLRLGKLIVLYDNNHITIEGNTQLAFTEDVTKRFASYEWHVQQVADGNDLAAISVAIDAAKKETQRPSLISIRTHIGFGSPEKQDTAAAHGEPLGVEEVQFTKKHLGWPTSPDFFVPKEVSAYFLQAVEKGHGAQRNWNERFSRYAAKFPELAKEFQRTIVGELPENLEIPDLKPAAQMSTRDASAHAINALAKCVPELIGGSADLAPSTKTLIKDGGDFIPANRTGRNLHFGVREHAMGAILNGVALHKGFIVYGATFLIFSDYVRPPIRLASMNGLPVIYVFTHDSIGLGEDGPTHQTVEQLAGLRSVPGLTVVRPADAHETLAAWELTIRHRQGPVALVLTRQKLPVLSLKDYPNMTLGVARGGYVLSDVAPGSKPDLLLVASGSEVHLALASQKQLRDEGINARVISLPSWNIFAAQTNEYRSAVLPSQIPCLAIEAGVSFGWASYVGFRKLEVVGIDHYGASAPGEVVMEKFGFTVENIIQRAQQMCRSNK